MTFCSENPFWCHLISFVPYPEFVGVFLSVISFILHFKDIGYSKYEK